MSEIKGVESQSRLMTKLTLSALSKVSKDSSCWKEPIIYKALLVSGLSVLTTAIQLIKEDINRDEKEA